MCNGLPRNQTTKKTGSWRSVECREGRFIICKELVVVNGPDGGFEWYTVYPAARDIDRGVLEQVYECVGDNIFQEGEVFLLLGNNRELFFKPLEL